MVVGLPHYDSLQLRIVMRLTDAAQGDRVVCLRPTPWPWVAARTGARLLDLPTGGRRAAECSRGVGPLSCASRTSNREIHGIPLVHLARNIHRFYNRRELVPELWDAGVFSYSSVLFSSVGAVAGLWIGFKLGN